MLSAGPAEIHHRYLIVRGDGRPAESAEVCVTGPGEGPDALGRRWMETNRHVGAVEV
jgi:hypothetical protein